jgi:hypothetical protein
MLLKNQSTLMKTILLLFCLLYSLTAFSQSLGGPLNINIDLSERYPTKNPVATGYKKTVVQYQNIDKEQLENNQALNIFLGKLQQLKQDAAIIDFETNTNLLFEEDKTTYKILFKRETFQTSGPLPMEVNSSSTNHKNLEQKSTIKQLSAIHQKDNLPSQTISFLNKKYIVLKFLNQSIGNTTRTNTTLYFLERENIK